MRYFRSGMIVILLGLMLMAFCQSCGPRHPPAPGPGHPPPPGQGPTGCGPGTIWVDGHHGPGGWVPGHCRRL